MPIREIITTVKVTFTDKEWNELVNLYNQLDALMDEGEQYPEVTDEGLQLLIANLQATLDSLLVDK
jgi:hypothetical protein